MQSLLIIINALAVLAATVLVFSLLSRYKTSKIAKQSIMGVMFGLGAIVTLLQPLTIAEGVQVDGRNLFIGFAGATAGVVGAIIAVAMTSVARVLIGGIGVWAAIGSMTIGALLGLLWRQLDNRYTLASRWRWILLGVMISASIPVLLFLPHPIGWLAFSTGGPVLLIIYLVGAILLGWLFEQERGFDMLHQDLVKKANTDPLTGVLNRRGLFREFHHAVLPKSSSGVAVIMLDLNLFKILNDQFGHDVGDQALLCVVSKVTSNIRSNDLFARLGGDEFAICAFGMTSQQAAKLISKLREKLIFEMELKNASQTANFTVSVGGVFSDAVDPDLDQLLAAADKEMMSSKLSSRQSRPPSKAGEA